ncbi:hypothetical protein [Actinopolyspora halophila]|nr:hypothetical protein [Actinopolyspora halophila]
MNADTCTTIMNAGGGVVLANVTSYVREPVQPCAESTEIVKAMEPELLKA